MAIILNVICEKNSRELVFLFISRISQATVGKSFECSFKKKYCSQRFLPALYTKIIDVRNSTYVSILLYKCSK